MPNLLPIQAKLLNWYVSEKRDLPWRKTDDPYKKFVAEIMLQQTQVSRVVDKYQEFVERFPSFEVLAKTSRTEVIRMWSSLGYNIRAVRLHVIAKRIVDKHEGILPSNPQILRTFKGVGQYTVAALSSFAFGENTAVVDTNIRRILTRLTGQTSPLRAEQLEAVARSFLPSGNTSDWNQALMDLGAAVCLPKPKCDICPLNAHCSSASLFEKCTGAVAHQRPAYVAPPQPPFKGSRRFFRGRIIEALRLSPNGLTLDQLHDLVHPDSQLPQFLVIVEGLESDGLLNMFKKAGRPIGGATVQLP